MANTRKPCHGCGSPRLRDADSVCAACRYTLDWAARAKSDVQLAAYTVGRQVPHYLHDGRMTNRPIGKALLQLCLVTFPEAPPGMPAAQAHGPLQAWPNPPFKEWRSENMPPVSALLRTSPDDSHYGRGPAVAMTAEQADALETLHEAISAGLKQAYADGLARGQDLLRQLAAGDLTVDAFNERRR